MMTRKSASLSNRLTSEVRAALKVFDRDSLVGAASEARSASGGLYLPVALASFLFFLQSACFFYLEDIHLGWLYRKNT